MGIEPTTGGTHLPLDLKSRRDTSAPSTPIFYDKIFVLISQADKVFEYKVNYVYRRIK